MCDTYFIFNKTSSIVLYSAGFYFRLQFFPDNYFFDSLSIEYVNMKWACCFVLVQALAAYAAPASTGLPPPPSETGTLPLPSGIPSGPLPSGAQSGPRPSGTLLSPPPGSVLSGPALSGSPAVPSGMPGVHQDVHGRRGESTSLPALPSAGPPRGNPPSGAIPSIPSGTPSNIIPPGGVPPVLPSGTATTLQKVRRADETSVALSVPPPSGTHPCPPSGTPSSGMPPLPI